MLAQRQGAKAVVASLWPVADDSTRLLMQEFYRLRNARRLAKVEALRQAQLGLLRKGDYRHPYFWAPFVLIGNWR
jgi:CHAT domain-containing protein